MSIQACPRCSSTVNVPDGLGQLRITCPNCKGQWYHPPKTEVSDLDFKCSRTGQPFIVRLSRSRPDVRFTIESIVAYDPVDLKKRRAALKTQLLVESLPDREGGPSLTMLAGAHVKGWLIDVADQSAARVKGEIGKVLRQVTGLGDGEFETVTRSTDDYSWHGFTCPSCSNGAVVLSCGKCGSFGCQGTYEDRPGGMYWRCGCGQSYPNMITGSSPSPVVEKVRIPAKVRIGRERRLALPAPERKRLPAPLKQLPSPDHFKKQK